MIVKMVFHTKKILGKIEVNSTPKISVIIPAYNVQNYVRRNVRSIQNQSMKDIELIIIDDFSTDNTTKIIEKLIKEDRRIKLIYNKINKGLFYTRNVGLMFAKTKYIQYIDTDDLLLGNILAKAYMVSIETNVDIIQYLLVIGTNKQLKIENFISSNKTIYQPELSKQEFFGKGHPAIANLYIWDKLIKKEICFESLNL